jgi:hypothetical protein
MTEPVTRIRRLSTGVIDVDFYRRRAAAERTACRSMLLRRLLSAKIILTCVANARPLTSISMAGGRHE